MELTLERIKTNNKYTLSRLYESQGKKLFALDVIEPPVRGLVEHSRATLDPGTYKLFLKPDKNECRVVPCFQRTSRDFRLGFQKVETDFKITEADFHTDSYVFNLPMFAGRLVNNYLQCAREQYEKFIMRLIIAKQQQDVVRVWVK